VDKSELYVVCYRVLDHRCTQREESAVVNQLLQRPIFMVNKFNIYFKVYFLNAICLQVNKSTKLQIYAFLSSRQHNSKKKYYLYVKMIANCRSVASFTCRPSSLVFDQ